MKQEIIQKINDLFIMTRFQYLIMNPDKTYITYNKYRGNKIHSLNDTDIRQHLNGKKTVGVFAGKEFTQFLTFDVDVHNPDLAKWTVYKLIDGLQSLGIPRDFIFVSMSGSKGYHVDIYFDHPIKNTVAKKLYLLTLNTTDLLNIDYGQVEYRPNGLKQGVKLPLGINFKTGNRCWYCNPLTLELIEDESYILSVKQISVSTIYTILDEQDDLYSIDTVSEVEETRNKIEGSVKTLDIYKQNIDPDETIDSIQELFFNGLKIPGTRHNSLFKLAKYFHYQGIEREECNDMLIEWMDKQDQSTYTTERDDYIKDIGLINDYIFDNDVQLTIKEKDLTVTYSEMLPILQLGTKNEKLLAYCLLIHSKRLANAKGIFYMSYSQMVEASGIDIRTTKRVIPKLNDNGILDIVASNQSQKGTYMKKPNKYKLNIANSGNSDKSFIISCDDIHYADSFTNTLTHLFTNKELHTYLPRRQYQSLIN